MKVGLIRCMQTEDICPGTKDFQFIQQKKGAFAQAEGDIDVVGFTSCGGCPGKRAVSRAMEMVRRGADTIVLCSCITRGNPIGFCCPHAKVIEESISKKVGETVKVIDYTH